MSGAPKATDGRDLRALMAAAQEGDADAYEDLLRASLPIVRGFILSRTRSLSTQDLEDLLQDILLSVHRARATYDPGRPFLPWLFAIARFRLTDRGRRKSYRVQHEVAVEKLPETFDEADANIPGETFGDVEALRAAISQLPEGQRRALELTKLRELSLRETSEETHMTIPALKVAVHRAVKTLREKLTKE